MVNSPINTELLLRKDGDIFESGVMDRKESNVEMQLEASRALAYFIKKCPQICVQKFEQMFIPMLNSYSANERQIASFVIYYFENKDEVKSLLVCFRYSFFYGSDSKKIYHRRENT